MGLVLLLLIYLGFWFTWASPPLLLTMLLLHMMMPLLLLIINIELIYSNSDPAIPCDQFELA